MDNVSRLEKTSTNEMKESPKPPGSIFIFQRLEDHCEKLFPGKTPKQEPSQRKVDGYGE